MSASREINTGKGLEKIWRGRYGGREDTIVDIICVIAQREVVVIVIRIIMVIVIVVAGKLRRSHVIEKNGMNRKLVGNFTKEFRGENLFGREDEIAIKYIQ